MFKKVYFNFAIRCMLAFVLLLIIFSTMFSAGTYFFYYKNMTSKLISVFESNLIYSFEYIINSQSDENDKSKRMENTLTSYSGILGLDENRKIYIINASDMSVITPASLYGEKITVTANIKSAASDKIGNKIMYRGDFLDCALPFDISENRYILYLRDNQTNFRAEIFNTFKFTLWSLIPAIIFSLIVAYLLAKRVTGPLDKITKRAEGFEKGELYENVDELKCSEFEDLIRAVNHMGYVMASSIQRMNGDKHRVEVILEHINNGIITFDNYQNLIQINSAAKRILKNDSENIKFDSFFKKLNVDVCMAEFSYLEKSTMIEKEITSDNQKIKVCFIPFKMDSERNAGVVCVLEDITEQFNVMEAMRKFVADVSHELKTPITVISSYTETVLNSYIDDKAMTANLLKIVYQEAGKMTELIQNLLDISKYEMNAVNQKKDPFSIDDMLNSLVDTFKMEAEKKELSLTYNRMTEIPEFVGSRGDIERAVKNIISNSIKYTSRGDKIRIFSGRLNNEIYIKVEDTGWGIPSNKISHLFERFYRVEEESRSRDKGGTGLGLSIAKEIIENHGGTIKIESEYTKYTRVTITLPLNS